MHSAVTVTSVSDLAPESPAFLDDEMSIAVAAEALLACHARNVDSATLLAMSERLLTVTERLMLERERQMMADGDDNLAAQVRRHGDVLFMLGQQVRALRRGKTPLPVPFLQFVRSLAERFRAPRREAA
jgi:hypothetical protein